MRKALIGLILAATALSPVAAGAQRRHMSDSDGEVRAERIQARNEARAERQTQAQPQQQQQQTVQIAQRRGDGNRGDGNRGGGNRGGWGRGDGNRGDGNRGDGNRGGRGDRGDRGTRQPSAYPEAWQGNPNSPDLRRYQRLEQQNQQRYGRGGDRGRDGDRDRDRNWRGGDRDRDGDRNWRGDNRRNWRGDWNRGWRNDRRYDWNGWRYRNRNIFNLGPYYSPYRDWRYQRFSIGFFLEPLFYSRNYWIGDPWQYRLPPAPPGTRWVRYYDDVLLVDTYSGEVVDVIHDFFW